MTQCSTSVSDTTGWTSYQCTRQATVDRAGKPYCTQHDPNRKQTAQDRRQRKYDAERKYRDARKELIDAAKAAIQDECVPEALTDAVSKFEEAETECRDVGIENWKLY